MSALIPFLCGLSATAVLAGSAHADTWDELGTPSVLAGPVLDDSTVITLERGPCFGRCPEYTLTMYGSGRVEFEGRRHVCVRGRHAAQASPSEVRRLVAQMLVIGYFDLEWKKGPIATQTSIVRSSLRHAGRAREIKHYVGDKGAPQLLRSLEDRIDAVAGTWRWLPEREDHIRVCRLEDGETTEPLEWRDPP